MHRFAALLLLSLLFYGCGSEPTAPASADEGPVPLTVGAATVQTEIVVERAAMQRGLMHRESLPEDRGMLFVFEGPRQMSFWMRNVSFDLDIGFFTADGILREVYPMYAYDESRVKSTGDDLQLALEVNRGWFRANGIQPGDRLDMTALAKVLRARGYVPESLGLATD